MWEPQPSVAVGRSAITISRKGKMGYRSWAINLVESEWKSFSVCSCFSPRNQRPTVRRKKVKGCMFEERGQSCRR